MSVETPLRVRGYNQFELYNSESNLTVYDVPPHLEQRKEAP
jgi:uncharacterized phage-like protein YoqJ